MLKIKLYRYKTLVFGEVVEQSEDITNPHYPRCIEVYADEAFKIESSHYPQLNGRTLYIRGNDSRRDNDIFRYNYGSVEDAINVCEEIKNAVDVINAKYDNIVADEVDVIKVM